MYDGGCAVDFDGLQGLRIMSVAGTIEATQVVVGLEGRCLGLDRAVLVEGCLWMISAHRHMYSLYRNWVKVKIVEYLS